MIYPKTIWNYSLYTEAVRILQIAYDIKNGFFQKKGFYVLPYLVPSHPRMVFFPKLEFEKFPHFWEKVKNRSQVLVERNDPIIEEIIGAIPQSYFHRSDGIHTEATVHNNNNFHRLRRDWQKVEKKFWKITQSLVPDFAKGIKTLEIRPTYYGAVASGFSIWLKENSNNKIIYVRLDVDVSHIAEAVLIDLMYKSLYEEKYEWEEAESLLDHLLTKTQLKTVFPQFNQTLSHLRDPIQGKYVKDSKKYLSDLRISNIQSIFSLKGGSIFLHDKPFKHSFTPVEEKILISLIKNKNKTLDADQLADIIWNEQSFDKFSSYAIAKHIQRIREKLNNLGLSQALIQTFKKRGYMLAD